ncbi:class I tRNA ligase family protein [Shewanella sp.]|uniref:class I tRNA ligase family protein n=1 Tax=Shewanella sp. TaxID=50422 RepID=UPI004053A61B
MNNKKYLLISAKPAPNGELHLGHLSGPYLAQDMYYRQLTANGHDVRVISGTDAVDSFIHLRALHDGVTPAQLAAENYVNIMDSFNGFSIHYDCFIDPFSPQWQAGYVGTMQEVVDRAQALNKTVKLSKKFPFSASGSPASGAWIVGECPDCHGTMSGYFCEDCGAHLEPSEMLKSRHRDEQQVLKMVEKADQFFRIDRPVELLTKLQKVGVRASELAVVIKQFEQQRTHVRLTEWSDWGIPFAGEKQVYFGHGLLYAYCRLIGQAYQALTGCEVHPFDQGSDVISINFFGIDNTASHMINIQAIGEEIPDWKGFDHFVVNHFYLLEGRKFSTSAGHVIKGSDVIRSEVLHPETVRFVLAATSPCKVQADFTLSLFLNWYNQIFIGQVQSKIIYVNQSLIGFSARYQATQTFSHHWQQVCALYHCPDFDPRQVVELLLLHNDTLTQCDSAKPVQKASWLAEMALLLYPLMPSWATEIWQACGYLRQPTLVALEAGDIVISTIISSIEPVKEDQVIGLFGGVKSAE